MRALTAKQKIVISVLIVVVTLLAITTYFLTAPSSPFTGLQNDLKGIEPSEELQYTDLNGEIVLLKTFKGKPLIINSWATWMPFSKDELSALDEVWSQYGDRVQIIAINRMEDRERVKAYLSTFGIPQNILFLIDPGDTFYKAVGGYAMPETIFYKADGGISNHIRGVLNKDDLNNEVLKITGN